MAELRSIFIDYEMAQKLIPFFMELRGSAPMVEARRASGRILDELDNVRNIDYGVTGGYQVRLQEIDYQFFKDTIEALGL